MGRVYDATQVELGRRVALKVLAPGLAKNPSILERFRREALAAAVLGHPHIVDVTDFVLPDEGPPFLVMERLAGEPLMDVLQRDGMLAIPRAIRISVQLLDALQVAHDAGIVHRDLKPANVFLVALAGGDEMVKLLDFGVAKLRDAPGQKLTAVGEMVGTPRFAAPEQLKGGTVDARTDVYGAGVLLYGMLTGQPPFNASMADLVRSILEDDPVDPRVVNPSVDPTLASIVARAMAKEPHDRFDSAQAMMEALGGERSKAKDEAPNRQSVAAVAVQANAGPKKAAASKGRGPVLITAAAMILFAILLAAGVGFAAYQLGSSRGDGDGDDRPPPPSASAVAGQTESCEEYVRVSCECPGDHRVAICDRARESVMSLRRSVQIGATTIETASGWCQSMLQADDLCAYESPAPPPLAASDVLSDGVHPAELVASDATRSDGAFIDRFALNLREGERVEVWAASEEFDTYLVLRNPNGRVVAVNDDAGSMPDGTDAQLVYYPRHDGQFLIEAGAARAGDVGEYEVIVNLGEPQRTPARRGRRQRTQRPRPQPRQQGVLPEAWRDDQPRRPMRNDDVQAPPPRNGDRAVPRNDGRGRGARVAPRDPW